GDSGYGSGRPPVPLDPTGCFGSPSPPLQEESTMDPEDLPGLDELDEIDLGAPEPGAEPEPLLPPVEPAEPEPARDPIDLGELDLPDLPDREWGGPPQGPPPAAPDPVELPDGPAPMDRPDAAAPAPVELDLDRGGLGATAAPP